MLNLLTLAQDLHKIIDEFGKSTNLEQLEFEFFRSKILQIDFKLSKKKNFDFYLSFQEKSLVDWLDHLENLGKKIINGSLIWSNAKLEYYELFPFKSKKKLILNFNFNKKDLLTRIFKTEFNSLFKSPFNFKSFVSSSASFLDLSDHCAVISIRSKDEWLNLRIKLVTDCLIKNLEFLNKPISLELDYNDLTHCIKHIGQDIQLDNQLSTQIESTKSLLDRYENVFLVLPESANLKNLNNLIKSNYRIIRIGNVVCNLDRLTYRSKLKEALRDEFIDETIDKLIKMKLLSFKPDFSIKLDLDYKQIVFFHYNYARIFSLIKKCSKIFNSNFKIENDFLIEFDRIDLNDLDNNSKNKQNEYLISGQLTKKTTNQPSIANQSVNPLLNDLKDYTFNNHFISFSSFLLKLDLNQTELITHKVTILLALLCNDLSKYYQKKKVLSYSPSFDLVCFKINLLRSLLSMMKIYFNFLNVDPIESI